MKQLKNLILLIFFISCTDSIKNSETINAKKDILDSSDYNYNEVDSVKKINIEYLDWNTLKINNQLPLLTSRIELIKLLGNADSIVTPEYEKLCVSYFDTGYKFLYFGASQFELKDTMAVISSIDFQSGNIKLQSPKIILDKSTTFEMVQKLFPKAAKNAFYVVIDDNRKVLNLKLATSQLESDDAWVLLFVDGKLIKFEYWMPC